MAFIPLSPIVKTITNPAEVLRDVQRGWSSTKCMLGVQSPRETAWERTTQEVRWFGQDVSSSYRRAWSDIKRLF